MREGAVSRSEDMRSWKPCSEWRCGCALSPDSEAPTARAIGALHEYGQRHADSGRGVLRQLRMGNGAPLPQDRKTCRVDASDRKSRHSLRSGESRVALLA